MSIIVKSFAVGAGDTFYIRHGSDNFTIIDCDLCNENKDQIIEELKRESANKGVKRFISTHPDEDHYGGIHLLDKAMPIQNFYVVKNNVIKERDTESFQHYCKLRDGNKAFHISKGCKKKWMNLYDNKRDSSGINILWPNRDNPYFKIALKECNEGRSPNNISAVIRYKIKDGASFLWIGDLETEFMENIFDDIELEKTTIVFASHHGRKSGKIPDSWLEKLDPQIIVIGEAPFRHLHYYSGYQKLTQNRAGDITMECIEDKVHFYSSNGNYKTTANLEYNYRDTYEYYFGSLTVEKEYTLINMRK